MHRPGGAAGRDGAGDQGLAATRHQCRVRGGRRGLAGARGAYPQGRRALREFRHHIAHQTLVLKTF